MPHIKIEVFRNGSWNVRQEGDADVTIDQLADMLPGYTIQYPHRVHVDGALVLSSEREGGKVVVVRH